MEKRNRNSSFELLRLVCMFSIVLYHILSHSINGLSGEFWIYKSMTVFFHFGSVVFVLISGWFGIKLTTQRLLGIYLPLLFYTLAVFFIAKNYNLHRHDVFPILLLKDGNNLWFIQPYLFLCILSPFINRLIEKFSRNDYLYLLIILGIMIFFFGWIGNYTIAKDGKTTFCFIFFYVIGRFLKSEESFIRSLPKCNQKLGYAIILIAIIIFLGKYSGITFLSKISGSFFAYHSPGQVLLSVLILLLFSTFSFHSKLLNYLSESSFAIYLIASNPTVEFYIYKFSVLLYATTDNKLLFTFELVCVAAAICLICIVVDIVVRNLITRPCANSINKAINSLFNIKH